MEIIYIPYKDIDKHKWESCINAASHGSVYALPAYLDAITGEWDALVAGDYETVMPLFKRKKYGIKYLYQPAFLPHTGIYSAGGPGRETTDAFLAKAFRHFSFAEINIPYPLQFSDAADITSAERNNFILDLAPSYDVLHERYDGHFTKSLRRLQKLSLQYEVSDDPGRITALFSSLYVKKIKGLKQKHVDRFYDACIALQKADKVVVREAYSPKDELLCAVILLRFRDRLYNILSCNTAAGKKAEANYFLYDRIIEEFSGKGLVLDLEGSDIKGIADFYKKMNPENEPYHFIQYNALSGPLKLLKKKH